MTRSLDDRDPLDRLAEEFLDGFRRGERVAVSEYAARHPERAGEIRDLLSALLMVEGVKSDSGATLGPSGLPGRGRKAPPERLGEYRLLREVGRGGMGIVYEAEQETLGRRVALKVLAKLPLVGADYVLRFHREARAAARLHHTNIVPVFGVGEHDGLHYYVMQFIRGAGLDAVLSEMRRLQGEQVATGDADRAPTRVGRFDPSAAEIARGLISETLSFTAPPVEAAIRSPSDSTLAAVPRSPAPSADSARRYVRTVAGIGLQAAHALDYAHRQGVLHRDVKPSNLLLDPQGTVWVTDFGLAKATEDDDLTRSGDLVGTLRYMAPERFGGRCDARSDVYALGLTLYELLARRPAFDAAGREQLIRQVTQTDPPRLRDLRKDVPRDLETVIHKAIERDPSDRYPTAGDLARDLDRFLADRPIAARRASPAERTARWARRNPGLAVLGTSVALLLVAIAVGSTVAAVLLARKHSEAVAANQEARERLWDSYLSESRARRRAYEGGRRFESLKNVAAAAELGVHADRRWVLRDEAIACLALADLRKAESGTFPSLKRGEGLGVDADFTRYACRAPDGRVVVRGLAGGPTLAVLPGLPQRPVAFRFSPGGDLLVAKYDEDGKYGLAVWDIARREVVLNAPRGVEGDAFDISPDGRWLAAGRLDGSIDLYDLTMRQVTRRLPPGAVPHSLAFDADGRRLAVAGSSPESAVQVRRLDDGAIERTVTLPAGTYAVAWHPSGRQVAAGGRDGRVYLVGTGSESSEPRVFEGHQGAVVSLSFHPDGDLLASVSWDGTLRLWEVGTGISLVRSDFPDSEVVRFSRDGRRVGPGRDGERVWLWEVAAGRECRAVADGAGPVAWGAEFRPESGLLVAWGEGGLRFASPEKGVTIGTLELPRTEGFAFVPDGSVLLTSGESGLLRWPVMNDGRELRVGPPEPLGLPAGLPTRRLRLAPDGHTLAVVTDWERGRGVVLDLERPESKIDIAGHPGLERLAFSPDSRLLATGTWKGTGVKVWQTATGGLETTLDIEGTAEVLFRPDGRQLLTGSGREYRAWDVGTWRKGPEIERVNSGGLPGMMAFSADGSTLGLVRSRSLVQLVDPDTFEVQTTLVPPELRHASSLAFSGDGSRLAVTHNSRVLTLWDLRLVRESLASIELDLTRPALPAAAAASVPVSVRVEPPAWLGPARAAEAHAAAGRWNEAAEAYSDAFDAGDRSPRDWSRRALVLRAAGRAEDYARVCREATAHFGGDVTADLANTLAWTCAVGPGAADAAVSLAEAAGAGGGHLRLNTLGAVYYRVGRFEEAEAVLRRGVALHGSDGVPEDWLFLAMTCHRLGRSDEANVWLERAELRDRDGEQGPGSWQTRLERRLLEDEARALIGHGG